MNYLEENLFKKCLEKDQMIQFKKLNNIIKKCN